MNEKTKQKKRKEKREKTVASGLVWLAQIANST